ncbi:MAG: DUF309 domain-containing protein [Bacteroidales bacterium]|nr:DUF309 domain-containing protein [Bacteroidales bacterium]
MNKKENIQTSRYTNFDLPYWRYIPKYEQHPDKTPNRIHIPLLPESTLKFSEKTWQKSERYLYAIDLFNHKYYWEVHEVLEKIWLENNKNSKCSIFIQGIIQLSVALLKEIEDNKVGFNRLTKKSFLKLKTQKGIFLGIKIEDLINQHNSFIKGEIEHALIILTFNRQ